MKLSVILSTYNSPEFLEKSLAGYAQQRYRDFEIVVAEDGANPETQQLIREFREKQDIPLLHVHQKDDGFRKCLILNKAILASRGNYLVFSDGDCIPRSDFVAVHAKGARTGCFLSGGYTCLSRAGTLALGTDQIVDGSCFSRNKLKQAAQKTRLFCKHTTPRFLAPVLNRITPTIKSWNGHNSSAWKDDILSVNGFDERMEYGGEDREFGIRLSNLGLHAIQIRYSAICIHLDHDRPYVNTEKIHYNMRLRKESLEMKKVWTSWGIFKNPNHESFVIS